MWSIWRKSASSDRGNRHSNQKNLRPSHGDLMLKLGCAELSPDLTANAIVHLANQGNGRLQEGRPKVLPDRFGLIADIAKGVV